MNNKHLLSEKQNKKKKTITEWQYSNLLTKCYANHINEI
jgi:hypothetical protein